MRYSYDELHRLTTEEINDSVLGNETISYGYDAFGNRLTKGGSGDIVTYSYNDNDELGMESGSGHSLTYGYDDNGNAVSRGDGTDAVAYGYDYDKRLVSAGSVGYAYDADGIRVSSVSDGSVTNYAVDRNRQYAQVLEEKGDAGSVSYVHGDDLISRKQDGEVRYYVYDGHGSVRHLTDADGTVTDSYIYDAFGNLRDHLGNSDNRYLYAGEQYDADAGLYYLRARYYDPGSGRFLTHDPYPGNPDEPVTLHRYLYGNANPVSYVDPSGEISTLGEILIAESILHASFGILANIMSHSSRGRQKIRWKGTVYNGLCTKWNIGGGVFYVELISDRFYSGADLRYGEKPPRRGEYVFYFMGVSVGLAVSLLWGALELETPYFQSDPDDLAGLVSCISPLRLAPLPGYSYSSFSMGSARGD